MDEPRNDAEVYKERSSRLQAIGKGFVARLMSSSKDHFNDSTHCDPSPTRSLLEYSDRFDSESARIGPTSHVLA